VQPKRRVRADSEADHLKGRIAEALVEGMFMRAGYAVSRTGRESHLPRLFKSGKDEYLPDFMVRRPVSRSDSDRPLHQLIPVEVKYRRDISTFLHRHGEEFFDRSTCWPELYLVLVTDNPDAGRSCFQVLDTADQSPRAPQDLVKVHALDIYPSTVREYEHLVKKLFSMFDTL
jgi:hypothetical protein